MSAVAAVTNIDHTKDRFIAEGTITLSGNYGGASSHGDTLDLSGLGVPSNQLPTVVEIFEASPAGAAPSANIFRYMPGTTQANGSLSVFVAAGTEYTQASAYGTPPFAIVAFALKFRASFPAFL